MANYSKRTKIYKKVHEHLVNLKIFAEFKKDKEIDDFDEYIEFLSLGCPDNFVSKNSEKENINMTYSYTDPMELEKYEDKIEEYLNNLAEESQKSQSGFLLSTLGSIEEQIYTLWEKESYIAPKVENLFDVIKISLKRDRYGQLAEYIGVGEEDLFEYCTNMQHKDPQDFFTVFSKDPHKHIRDLPVIDCYPRIFKTCKDYEFFLLLKDNLKDEQANLNFIFYEMIDEKKIYPHSKPEFTALIDGLFEEKYEIYSKSKVTRTFEAKYKELESSFY